MKVEIEQVKSVELEHAHICAYELSDAIQQARQLLENNLKGILVTKDEKH